MVMQFLAELGYDSVAEKMKASEYGLPQRRTRYYIIGLLRKDHGSLFAEASSELAQRIPPHIHASRRSVIPDVARDSDTWRMSHD